MSLRMKDSLFTRNNGRTWGFILDLGEQDAQQCGDCQKRHWLDGGSRLKVCSKCGGELRDIKARRQSWSRAEFETQKQARDARDRKRGKKASGEQLVETSKETLATFLRTWLKGIENEIARTTYRGYSDHVRRFIIPALGHVQLGKLSPAMIRSFYSDLSRMRASGRSGTLGTSTLQRVHATLHRALETAVLDQKLPSNPAHKTKPGGRGKGKKGRPEIKVWTPEQLSSFLPSVRTDDYFAMWRLVAWTGLRRGEVCGLQWSDIDLETMRLTVRRSIVLVSYKPHVTTPKSGESRIVDLDAETVSVLKAHRAREIEARMALGLPRVGDDDYVFSRIDADAKTATFVHPDRVSKRFESLVRKSELPRIRFHDLRHTHASHLLAAGANIKVVSERLGHASIQITLDTYGHLMPNAQSEAVDALARLYA